MFVQENKGSSFRSNRDILNEFTNSTDKFHNELLGSKYSCQEPVKLWE